MKRNEQMDAFSEQLVKKTEDSSDGIKRIGIIAAGSVLFLALIYVTFIYTPFAIIAAAGVIFGTYYLLQNTFIEYEYIISNEYFDIDKIIAQKRRKNLLSITVKDITDFTDETDKPFDGVTYIAAGGDEPLKCAYFNSSDIGKARVLFSPNEKTLKNIYINLDRRIKRI